MHETRDGSGGVDATRSAWSVARGKPLRPMTPQATASLEQRCPTATGHIYRTTVRTSGRNGSPGNYGQCSALLGTSGLRRPHVSRGCFAEVMVKLLTRFPPEENDTRRRLTQPQHISNIRRSVERLKYNRARSITKQIRNRFPKTPITV